MKLNFKTLQFELKNDELKVNLLNIFQTKIPVAELGEFKLLDKYTIEVGNEKKFSFSLSNHFKNLINTINGNKAVYIHQNSGIPLIGSVSFGIVYRDTSLIEIKPITSCNLNCVYCSVGEGQDSKKVDYVVEKDYLVNELQNLLDYVDEPVEIHIGVQGEPFLYADLIPLIEDLQKNKQITIISMDTNFTLVTEDKIDQLAKFDKLRLNISLDAITPEVAEKMAGTKYDVNRVLDMITYAVNKNLKLLIAPLYLPGYNDDELEKIVDFVKNLGVKEQSQHPVLGIQNFLKYKTGRNPVRPISWEKFYEKINDLEKKSGFNLKITPESFGIRKTKQLEKPFHVDDVISARLVAPDRFKSSSLAAAKNRIISIPNCEFKENKAVKLKIIRDKHNIFTGGLVK